MVSKTYAAPASSGDSTGQLMETACRHFAAARLDDAGRAVGEVLRRAPHLPDALHIAGAIAYRRKEYSRAIDLVGRAIQGNPSAAIYYNTRALALRDSGNPGAAVEDLQRALARRPDYADALVNLGSTFDRMDQAQRAWECYRAALSISPDCAEGHHEMARLLLKERHLRRALLHCQRYIALKPGSADAYATMGAILRDSGDFAGAIENCRKALAIDPRHHCAHSNLAVALKGSGRTVEALEMFDRALAIEPENPQTRFNRALTLLAAGDLAAGWAEYEWGLTAGTRKPKRPFTQPMWRGQPLEGKTILVWGEQGLGDEMYFASMTPDVARAAGACILECESRLTRLFARSFPNVTVVPRTAPPHPATLRPDIDFQVPAGSLAARFRTSLASFPQEGYLAADPDRRAFWSRRVAMLGPGLAVGICWRSKVRSDLRDRHYTTLEELRPVFSVPGVRFINLQYHESEPEVEAFHRESGVRITSFPDLDLMNDLDEVAALIPALDLVISVDTAVAAMAGALGAPLWQLTLYDNEWGTFGTDRIPWWRDARVFRREVHHESWEPAIRQAAGELAALAAR